MSVTHDFARDERAYRSSASTSGRWTAASQRAIVHACLAALIVLFHPVASKAASNLRACDYYASANTPCVAAHSTTRALFASYSGRLYQVQRKSDGQTLDIGLLAAGDYANAAAQDAFCAGTTCIITIIYDQTSNHNDLTIEGPGGNGGQDVGAPADALPVTAGGHQVYGVSFSGQMGYRNDTTIGVAKNGKPETMYMVTSGTHVNDACCFDYGNAETDNKDRGAGHMDALNFSPGCMDHPARRHPWVKADMENGVFSSDEGCSVTERDRPQGEPYVTALLKNNGQNFFALKYADAQDGPLTTGYSGPEPKKPGYSPMHQEGAIVLGTGGDDSNGSIGSFFEGVMTAGLSPDSADDQVQADIVAVGYGGSTGLAGALQPGNEISLMTSEPNASAYLVHRREPSDDQRAVVRTIDKETPAELRQSATWIVRRGFTNVSCLAFESRDLPGTFLRHDNDKLVVVPDDGSAGFAADSTFCPVAGLDGSGSSFQAADASGKYIRVFEDRAFIASDGGPKPHDTATRWKRDVSFTVTKPLAP